MTGEIVENGQSVADFTRFVLADENLKAKNGERNAADKRLIVKPAIFQIEPAGNAAKSKSKRADLTINGGF